MEFSRRGPATAGAGDGHRFPDPPAHGEREPVMVTRDALLSQLHMACLRKEIIEAELAKIERDMVLRTATSGHQTQTTPMPMPWHGMVTADAGRSQLWPFSAEQPPMAQQNAEFDEHKLPDSNKDALLSQFHMARLRQETIEAELDKIERAMALCAATGGHQTLPTPLPVPWHGVATADAGRSMAGPFRAEQPVVQQNAEFDGCELPDSNTAVPPSKTSPAETCKLTGITIPVKKPNPSIKWNCTVCQVQTTSEQNLQQHYAGQKHLENVATLDRTTKASDQKAKTAAEPSLGTEEKKTSSIKWSCSTCQANGTSQSTLEAHLKGKRHQQNIAATSVEGDNNSMQAKTSTELSLGTEQKKTSPIKWSCSTCQAHGTSQSTLEAHLKGRRHQQNIAATSVEGDNNSMQAKTSTELSLGTEQKKTSPIKWSCSTCQAHGTSQSTLEAHLKGRRHQQNIAATSVEGNKNGMPKNVAAQEAKSHGINLSKNSENLPSAWSCSICEVVCTCQNDLKNHLRGIRHRETVQSLLEQSKSMARDSESQKAKFIPDSRWMCSICHAHCTGESDFENHLARRRHQLNVQALREKIKKENNNQPQLDKNKESTSELNCAMCEAKCNSKSQFEAHCRSSRHQQKIQAILGKGKIAEGSSSSTANELHSHGPNSKNARSEMVEKQPALYFCEICSLLFESSTMLVHHRFGKKHRAKLSARNESS